MTFSAKLRYIAIGCIICSIFVFGFFNSQLVRLQKASRFMLEHDYDRAVLTFEKIVRKERLVSTFEGLVYKHYPTVPANFDTFIRTAYRKSVNGHFNQAAAWYRKGQFSEAIDAYDKAIFYFNQLRPFFSEQAFAIVKCDPEDLVFSGDDIIFKLYRLALRVGDSSLSNLRGVNLLFNPQLFDDDNNRFPDGYIFSAIDPSGVQVREVVVDSAHDVAVYHLQVDNLNGWFANYFKLGRVPANTSFVLSFEIIEIDPVNYQSATLYTTTASNGTWNSGTKERVSLPADDLGSGWQRRYVALRTNEKKEIFLEGWLAAWKYGIGSGELYIRKPKVEIGDEPTPWSLYLKASHRY